jgi:L-lactate dehydrogenase
MVKDPVCGMEVDENQAKHKAQHMGKTYYFCASACKDTFEKNPERYLKRSKGDDFDPRKVAIVGTGQVGATFAFALMISGLSSSIILIDQAAERAEGHAMDLNHSLPFVAPCNISVGDYSDCRDTDIFKQIIPEIVKHNPRMLVIVSNPVDVLTYVTLKVSGYSMNRIIGSGTVLDSARFRSLLGKYCRVDPRNVHAYIIGEHGDSEVPVWSQANIGGISFLDYCPMYQKDCSKKERDEIFNEVKRAAYEIIKRKGATNFAIGLSLVRIAGSILRDENSVLTVSTLLDNYYDISDVCLSVPVILNRDGVSKILKIGLDQSEIASLQASANVLKDVIRGLDI